MTTERVCEKNKLMSVKKQTKKEKSIIKKRKKREKRIELLKEEKKFLNALKSSEFDDYVRFVKNPWKVFLFGFLRGSGLGLGTLLGATVLLTIVSYVINWLYGFPVIGQWAKLATDFFDLKLKTFN